MARTASRHRPNANREPRFNKLGLIAALLVLAAGIWVTAGYLSRSLARAALGGEWTRDDGLTLTFYLLDQPRLIVTYPRTDWGSSIRHIQIAAGPDGASASVTGTIEFTTAPCLGPSQTATLSSFNAKDADSDQDMMKAEFAGVRLRSRAGGVVTVDATEGTMTVLQRLKGAIARPEDAILSATGPITGQPLHLEIKRKGKQLTVSGGIEGEFTKPKE